MSVSIHSDDVAARDEQALPQRLALAAPRAQLRQQLLMDVDRHAQLGGDLARAIGRVGIDQHDLVQQRHLIHQGMLHRFDHVPDRLFFIQGGQRQADGHALFSFQRHAADRAA